MTMITENYCECDEMVHAIFDVHDFYSFKMGRIRCPKCGKVVRPCNECLDENGNHYDCDKCLWKNAGVKDAMTDVEYIKWVYHNRKYLFQIYLLGRDGDYWKGLAEKVFLDHGKKM